MNTRSKEVTISFVRPFRMKGIDRILPPGDYRIVTDEEMIEGLSFPVFRRVATMMMVPAQNRGSIEMVVVDPRDLDAALARDMARVSEAP